MKELAACHVLVTPTSYGRNNPSLKTELEKAVGKVTYNTTDKPLTSAHLAELLPEVDGYIAGLDVIDAAALAQAGQLQVISRYGVGVSNVDLAVAREKGITVTNTPGANAQSVAELTMALILNLLRPILDAVIQTREGTWPRTRGQSLVDKTIGLIGLGSVGKAVARRLTGFDCRILAYDVQIDSPFAAEHHIEIVSQETLLQQADIVSLHLPVLPETRGMVNDDFLQKMKDSAYLINTSRGELVDEGALFTTLTSGKLAGAALDAFRQEPPGAENPLLRLPQVIPTPHMGAHTDGATNAMGSMALADCLAVLQGQEPLYPVE